MKHPVSLSRIVLLILLIAVVGIGGVLPGSVLNADPSNASLSSISTRIIPTIPIPTAPARCDPKQIPAQFGRMGIIAIKPHLCAIPTFTEQDVRDYMRKIKSFSSLRIEQISPHFMVTRILFVTNNVANGILNADTGSTNDNQIVCYVEVYGDFIVASPFGRSRNPPIMHHGQIVFDGTTGNQLVIGVRP